MVATDNVARGVGPVSGPQCVQRSGDGFFCHEMRANEFDRYRSHGDKQTDCKGEAGILVGGAPSVRIQGAYEIPTGVNPGLLDKRLVLEAHLPFPSAAILDGSEAH